MYNILLSTHILVGIASLLTSVGALFQVVRGMKKYKFFIVSLATLSFFEIASGIGLLVVQATHANLLHFCISMGIYLIVVGGVEGILIYKYRQALAAALV